MSAGEFFLTRYQTNEGQVAAIRLQPETELLSIKGTFNEAPEGPITSPVRAKASKGNREYGIGPRKVAIVFPPGGAPTGYEAGNLIYLCVLTPTFFNSFKDGDVGQYLNKPCTVVSKLPERIK